MNYNDEIESKRKSKPSQVHGLTVGELEDLIKKSEQPRNPIEDEPILEMTPEVKKKMAELFRVDSV